LFLIFFLLTLLQGYTAVEEEDRYAAVWEQDEYANVEEREEQATEEEGDQPATKEEGDENTDEEEIEIYYPEEDVPWSEENQYQNDGEDDSDPNYEEDEDEGTDKYTEWGPDMPDYNKLKQHDCNTIREFDVDNVEMEPWIRRGRKFKDKRMRKYIKYNWAYGIPIFGTHKFLDDSMRRACYLVRYLFADNEQFRRMMYKSKMEIRGGAGGGFCCPAHVTNSGMSCPCWKMSFPILQIFTFAHEMAHWYIKRVLPRMYQSGGLKLPEFVTNATSGWTFTTPEKVDQPGKPMWEAVRTWLYNAASQDKILGNTGVRDPSKTHHYFIYTGQDKYLSLPCGGECRDAKRRKMQLRNTNLFNLQKMLWPCNNDYISVCEDYAFNFKKGLAQKLRIGKSDPDDISKMICTDDDTAEIEEDEVPKDPEDLSQVDRMDTAAPELNKCLRVINREGWLKNAKNTFDLPYGEVAKSLPLSNERAWWSRKCCSVSAKFVEESEEYKKEKAEWFVEVARKKALAEAHIQLEEAESAVRAAVAAKKSSYQSLRITKKRSQSG